MNKADLAAAVADKTGLPKQSANLAVDAVFSLISDAMKKGEEVRVSGSAASASQTAPQPPAAILKPERPCRSRRPSSPSSSPARG
jgi:hypothetical protein